MNETKKFYLIMYGLWFLAFLAVWFVLSRITANKDIYHNSPGAAAVADRIDSAKDLNKQADAEREKAQAGIAGAERSADRIEASIDQSADINSQLSASIDRCQQILYRVQQRGATEKK